MPDINSGQSRQAQRLLPDLGIPVGPKRQFQMVNRGRVVLQDYQARTDLFVNHSFVHPVTPISLARFWCKVTEGIISGVDGLLTRTRIASSCVSQGGWQCRMAETRGLLPLYPASAVSVSFTASSSRLRSGDFTLLLIVISLMKPSTFPPSALSPPVCAACNAANHKRWARGSRRRHCKPSRPASSSPSVICSRRPTESV